MMSVGSITVIVRDWKSGKRKKGGGEREEERKKKGGGERKRDRDGKREELMNE